MASRSVAICYAGVSCLTIRFGISMGSVVRNYPRTPRYTVRWSGAGSTQPACQHETVLEGDTTHPAGDDSVLPEDDVGHEGTLADEDAFDALDQMIRDVEPENLDDRKLKKLE